MQSDPAVYARGVAVKPTDHVRVLGIDLGTNCGIAFMDYTAGRPIVDATVWLDQWDLSIGTYDSTVLRHVRLQQFLSVLQPDFIGFEDVKVDVPLEEFRNKPGALVARIVPTAEFLGTLKIILSLWAHTNGVPLQGFQITSIKKYATGKGNASKVDMINTCNTKLHANLDPENYDKTGVDNVADAAFIMAMMVEGYSHGVTGTASTSTEPKDVGGQKVRRRPSKRSPATTTDAGTPLAQ